MHTHRFEYIPDPITLLTTARLNGEPLGPSRRQILPAPESGMKQIIVPLKLNGTNQILLRLMPGSVKEGSLTLGAPQPEYSLTINSRPPLYIGLSRYISGRQTSIRLLVPLMEDGPFDVDAASKSETIVSNINDKKAKELLVVSYESILPYYHVLDFNLNPELANAPVTHFRNATDLRRQVLSK